GDAVFRPRFLLQPFRRLHRMEPSPGGPMARPYLFVVAAFVLILLSVVAEGQPTNPPTTVEVHNGSVTLHALLWRPNGKGPFPTILFNHGSGRTQGELQRLGPYENQAEIVGPVFARHGYIFLYLFRRGVGLSADAGTSAIDLMSREFAAHGQEARNALQIKFLEDVDLTDALAGLPFLPRLPEVNTRKIAVIGQSFGGSLTLLLAEREANLRAALIFSGSGNSWDRSPELRERLFAAVAKAQAPMFFIHAENDYSLAPGKELD